LLTYISISYSPSFAHVVGTQLTKVISSDEATNKQPKAVIPIEILEAESKMLWEYIENHNHLAVVGKLSERPGLVDFTVHEDSDEYKNPFQLRQDHTQQLCSTGPSFGTGSSSSFPA